MCLRLLRQQCLANIVVSYILNVCGRTSEATDQFHRYRSEAMVMVQIFVSV